MRGIWPSCLAVVLAACSHAGGTRGAAGSGPTSPSAAPAAGDAPAVPGPVAAASPPTAKLTIVQARQYMLQLINRDRATAGLAPVQLDDGPAQRSGQGHAEDMAKSGFLGHWGSDGSVPEERYTDAGGSDMVLENASCFTDERARSLDHDPRVDPKNVEQTEDMFFHEQPPHDGHRKNILKPWHARVGIGVAQPVATATEIPVPCFSQEFVDDYGTYAAVPGRLHVGASLHVEGSVSAPATFAGVGLARIDAPKPIPVAELNRRRSYPVPTPYQMYWPPGYQTPIPVKVSGTHFAIDVPVSDGGKAGLYELSVWATVPGSPDLAMVSLRTFTVQGP
jgi:uncharacterized protein YkwD